MAELSVYVALTSRINQSRPRVDISVDLGMVKHLVSEQDLSLKWVYLLFCFLPSALMTLTVMPNTGYPWNYIISITFTHVHSPYFSAPNTDVIEHMCRKLYENKRYDFRPGICRRVRDSEFVTGT